MYRHLGIALIITLASAGCDKKSNDTGKATATAKAGSAATPTTPAAATTPAAPVAAKDRVLATGVLDLELVERAGKFILRDEAYQITFPLRPAVEGGEQMAPSGVKLRTASALANTDDDVYGLFVIPVPPGVPYDVETGLTGARDGALKNVNAKLTGEVKTTFGGLDGRKATGAAVLAGKDVKIDLYLAYDKAHHTVIGLFYATTQAVVPRTATDFIASFKVDPDGKAPPAGTGK